MCKHNENAKITCSKNANKIQIQLNATTASMTPDEYAIVDRPTAHSRKK
jgi:hypothetical protein